MVHRIEVGLKQGIRDALGDKVCKRIRSDLGLPVESVETVSVFTLDMDLPREELEAIATGPFLDPIIQEYRIDGPLASGFNWLAEVGFKPGVTDNVGKTAREAIERPPGRGRTCCRGAGWNSRAPGAGRSCSFPTRRAWS